MILDRLKLRASDGPTPKRSLPENRLLSENGDFHIHKGLDFLCFPSFGFFLSFSFPFLSSNAIYLAFLRLAHACIHFPMPKHYFTHPTFVLPFLLPSAGHPIWNQWLLTGDGFKKFVQQYVTDDLPTITAYLGVSSPPLTWRQSSQGNTPFRSPGSQASSLGRGKKNPSRANTSRGSQGASSSRHRGRTRTRRPFPPDPHWPDGAPAFPFLGEVEVKSRLKRDHSGLRVVALHGVRWGRRAGGQITVRDFLVEWSDVRTKAKVEEWTWVAGTSLGSYKKKISEFVKGCERREWVIPRSVRERRNLSESHRKKSAEVNNQNKLHPSFPLIIYSFPSKRSGYVESNRNISIIRSC